MDDARSEANSPGAPVPLRSGDEATSGSVTSLESPSGSVESSASTASEPSHSSEEFCELGFCKAISALVTLPSSLDPAHPKSFDEFAWSDNFTTTLLEFLLGDSATLGMITQLPGSGKANNLGAAVALGLVE